MQFDHLNRRFIDFKKAAFSVGQEAENDFKVPIEDLYHRLFDIIDIAFWGNQEEENAFPVPLETSDSRTHQSCNLL